MMLCKTVGALEAEMGARELAEWRRLCDDEVLGQERSDYWHGTMLATYINAHRDTRKTPAPYSAADMLPRKSAANESEDDDASGMRPMTDDDIMAFFKAGAPDAN